MHHNHKGTNPIANQSTNQPMLTMNKKEKVKLLFFPQQLLLSLYLLSCI